MNVNCLKLLMMGLMVFDYISYFVLLEWVLIFYVIICCVGVFFGYMVVEGFNYIWNVYCYNGCLYIWVVIMFVGNMFLNYLVNNLVVVVYNNIFFILVFGVSMLIVIKVMLEMLKISLKIVLLISILVILGIGVMFVEGGIVMLFFMLIMYLVRKRFVLWNCLYGVLVFFFLVISF